jgi:hypothetical protein
MNVAANSAAMLVLLPLNQCQNVARISAGITLLLSPVLSLSIAEFSVLSVAVSVDDGFSLYG